MKYADYNLAHRLKDNIEKAGYKRPTDIQYKSINHIMNGEDVMAIAQTGTGKTAAFAIPIIHAIHLKNERRQSGHVKAVVMAPTHELALQIATEFNRFSSGLRVKSVCIYGGVDQDPQKEKLEKGVDVVIATPGRLFDLVSQGDLDISKIDTLVLDEADHMLDLGFIKDIRDLMKRIPKNRQTLFFSATLNPEIKKLAYSLVRNAIRIQISPKDPVSKNIQHAVAHIEMDDKRFFLESLIKQDPEAKTLVFVRTKVRAERVKKAMSRMGIETDTIHSDRTQDERADVMHRFRSGALKVLIATDVSARGIDIPNVQQVVNYDIPESSENYVHRVGRTGRGREKGQAISFCSPQEEDQLVEIEMKLGKPIDVVEIDRGEYKKTIEYSDEHIQDLNSLMKEVETLESRKKKKKKRK